MVLLSVDPGTNHPPTTDCPSSHQLTGTDLQRKHIHKSKPRQNECSQSVARTPSFFITTVVLDNEDDILDTLTRLGALASDSHSVTSEASPPSDKAVQVRASRRALVAHPYAVAYHPRITRMIHHPYECATNRGVSTWSGLKKDTVA